MKLNNYTYFLSFALLCTSALFGAASSSDQPEQAYILHDDQENRQAEETMATLEERYLTAQQERISPVSSFEQKSLSDDRERKRAKHPEEPKSAQKKQSLRSGFDHVTLQTNDGGNEDISLSTARAYSGLLKNLTDEYPSEPINIILPDTYTKTSLSLIADLLRSRANHTTAHKLYVAELKYYPLTTIDTVFEFIMCADYLQIDDAAIIGALTKLLERDHAFNDAKIHDFIQRLPPKNQKIIAQTLAKGFFIKLYSKKEGRDPELLPDWLREHFTGVSIQDLIDYGTDFKSLLYSGHYTELRLNKMYINNLTGLNNIPGITNITLLNLSDNQLTSIEHDHFAGLQKLKRLILDSNRITSLKPGVFTSLQGLKELDLSYNRITSLELGVFSNLPLLRLLNLEQNQITSLVPGLFTGLDRLELLHIANNQLVTIELGLFNHLTHLELLNLSNNRIISLTPGVFNGLQKLKELNLAENLIIALVPNIFIALQKLERLILHHNRITSLEPAIFNGLQALIELNLDQNQIISLELGVFNNVPQLTILELAENQIISIIPGVFANLEYLDLLKLNNNPIANNTEERARIEEEVNTATNSEDHIIW